MLGWIRKKLSKSGDALAPEPPASPSPPARPSLSTTWQERAAALGALAKPGEEPPYTPAVGLSAGDPRNQPSKTTRYASSQKVYGNPLHMNSEERLDFFIHDPMAARKLEAADALRRRLGSVDGEHYSKHAPEVMRLISEKDYTTAAELLSRLVIAVEAETEFSHKYTPLWCHSHLADILRTQGKLEQAEEIETRLTDLNRRYPNP